MTISSGSDGPRHVGRIVDPLVREDGDSEPQLELADPLVGPKAAAAPTGDAEAAAVVDPAPTEASPPQAPSPPQAEPVSADPAPEAPPSAELASPPSASAVAAAPPVHASPGSGHPVRDKLLERARALKQSGTPSPSGAPGTSGVPAPARQGLSEFEEVAQPQTARDEELERVGMARVRPRDLGPLTPSRGQLSPTMVAVFGSLIGLATVATLIALAMNFDPQVSSALKPKASAEAAVASLKPKAPVGAVPERKRQKVPGPWRIVDAKSDPTLRLVEGKIGRNAFLVALADAGVQQKEAYRLLIAYKGVRDLDNCDKNDSFRALIERGTSRLKAFEYVVSAEEIYQAREDANGYLKASKLDLKVGRHQIMGAFMYDGENVSTSAKPAGFDEGLREVLSKALDGHMDVDELEKGDRLRVVAQEVTVLGEFARYAGIEALEVLPKDPKAKPLRVYYFHHATAAGYYSERGQAPYEGGWRKPIKDASVTSKFNPTRMHPVLKKIMPHTGTDFGAPSGTPVGASSYGTIAFIGPAGPSGNLVKIEHPGGIETGYAHLSRFAEGLGVGDKVKRLQLVGYVGSTGRSTGPHLHFTAKRDGKFFDAETLNLDGLRVLGVEFRPEFDKVRVAYDKLLNAIPLPPPAKDLPEAELAKAPPAPTAPDAPETPDEAAQGDGEEEGSSVGNDEADLGSADEGAQEEAAVAAPAAPTPAGVPAKPAAKGAAAVYLSDKELLELQSVSDDGEVEK